MTDTTKRWPSLPSEDVFSTLEASAGGLSTSETARRLAQVGPNGLAPRKKKPAWTLFLGQSKNFLLTILIVAAVVSGVLAILGEGDLWDPLLILIIVLFAAVFGFVQEYRSERALEALQRMAAPTAPVGRDGAPKEIPAREVIPSDVVVLQVGDRIPADGRVIEQMNLKTDEAPLTGESVAVEKTLEAIPNENTVYADTTMAYGREKEVVTATGMETQLDLQSNRWIKGQMPGGRFPC
jgi:Ca2+-transporting ATPase